MKNFDLDIKNSELNFSFVGETSEAQESAVTPNAPPQKQTSNTNKTTSEKPSWIKGAESYQDLVKSFTEYGADKSGYGYYEKFQDPQGQRKRILGLDPLVFVAVSLGLVVASAIVIVYLKPKGAK